MPEAVKTRQESITKVFVSIKQFIVKRKKSTNIIITYCIGSHQVSQIGFLSQERKLSLRWNIIATD